MRTTVASSFGGDMTVDVVMPAGLTVAEMIDRAVPGREAIARERLVVSIIGGDRPGEILTASWERVRLKPGMRLHIDVVPGENAIKGVLNVLVSIAALAVAGPLGAALGLGQFGQALLAAGLTFLGNALVSILFPPPKQKDRDKGRGADRIDGFQNRSRPNEPIRAVFGKMRIAPDYAIPPYTEIAGDIQYVRTAFVVGIGQHILSGRRIGDTDIAQYEEVQTETQDGAGFGGPLNLIRSTVIEDRYGLELVNREKLNDVGEPIGDGSRENPMLVRFTANHASSFTVILGFPGGLYEVDAELADDTDPWRVTIEMRWREFGSPVWQDEVFTIEAKKEVAFFRAIERGVSARGPIEVSLRRASPEQDSNRFVEQVSLIALQTNRPEYPIITDRPLCIEGVRVKATYQLNGTLDSYNLIASRVTRDWTGAAWVPRETSNPAAHALRVLTSDEGPFPYPDSMIDWEAFQDWHNFCAGKGLKYDAEIIDEGSTLQRLGEVCAAGRAAPRFTGTKWTIVIDRPSNDVVAHFSPLEVSEIKWQTAYPRHPDGYRVQFLDATNNYEVSERVIPWPGRDLASVEIAEQIEMPGKTDPAEVWREARRKQYEAIARTGSFSFSVEGMARPETRGDLVACSFDILDQTLWSSRVAQVRDRRLILTDTVEFEDGKSYAIRFERRQADRNVSIVSRVVPGVNTSRDPAIRQTRILTVVDGFEIPIVTEDDMPVVGFGPLGAETVKGYIVEAVPTELGWRYTCIPDAPEIDANTDAEIPPLWDGRVGDIPSAAEGTPGTPSITFVQAQIENDAYVIRVGVAEDPVSPVRAATIEVDYREQGNTNWTTRTIIPASGGVSITGFSAGDVIEIRARAVGAGGTPSAYTAIRTYTAPNLGPTPMPAPTQLTAVQNGAEIDVSWMNSNDSRVSQAQVYRGTGSQTFDQAGLIASINSGPTDTRVLADTPGSGTYRYWVTCSGGGTTSDPAGPATITAP
ncbi:hypothetical protein DYI37_03070 [Fulvimarina endophytica]|uniref:Tip attachment protein J HDII-ins2 domain-containing protein n=1 Tax=Fulvimarina endophytica TaxID=2293836 RepID=A0A371XB53_9HYPH|nr:hypothetical protein DYI37_03070 [Fulvimarina endophytica]